MLLFVDIDGTLVGASGAVSDEVLEAADVLRELGVRIVVATGRPAVGATSRIAERLDAPAPHIYLNGALVQTGRGRTIHEVPIDPEALETMLASARSSGDVLEFYTASSIFVDEMTDASAEHAEKIGAEPVVRDLEDVLDGESVLKAQWITAEERAEEILKIDAPDCVFEPASSPVMPETVFVNVTHGDASKGEAAERVADRLGIELAEAVGVGDSPSDEPLLERVGDPYLMENAPAAMREGYATVGPISEDGVLEVFEQVAQRVYRLD